MEVLNTGALILFSHVPPLDSFDFALKCESKYRNLHVRLDSGTEF
jgi:hypothetical protein